MFIMKSFFRVAKNNIKKVKKKEWSRIPKGFSHESFRALEFIPSTLLETI